jgi:hypothetical protein
MHETSRHLYANVRLKIKGSAPRRFYIFPIGSGRG